MISKKLVLSIIGAMVVLGSTAAVAREAGEGPRGEGKGHPNSVDTSSMILAREAGEGPRGEGKGHPNGVDAASMILARRGADDPVPHPRGEGVGHPNSVDINGMILAREASEGPRGADNERPGDRQRRGGRNA